MNTRVKLTGLLSCAVLICAVSALGQPSIGANGVVNGASYAGPAASGANVVVAQGSIVAIFGKNLGPATIVQALATPLPTQLPNASGTSVQITAGGSSFNCFMLYAVSAQVGCIVPSTVPVGTATFTVTYNGQTSAGQAVTVAKQSFGLFTKNQGGSGPAVVQNVQSDGSVVVNGLSTSAKENQVLTLYGTGLGPISGADNVAPGAVNLSSNVKVTIGGQTLTPQYAGRSPQYAGLDQINVQLPASFAISGASPSDFHVERVSTSAPAGSSLAGCYTPMAVATGSSVSPGVVVSLASGGGTCTSPLGFSPAALASLDAGGSVTIGLALAGRFGLFGVYGDGAGAEFFQGTANDAYLATLSLAGLGTPLQTFVKPGTCTAYNAFTQANPTSSPSLGLSGFTRLLDAGSSLTLAGPGVTKTMAGVQGGYGTSGSAPFLANGTWTLTGTGGTDIGAFTASLNIPVLTWTNAVTPGQTVSRNSPLTVTWTGGGPNDVVSIAGSSISIDILNLNDPTKTYEYIFNCVAPASAGTFTVPQNIMQTMQPTITSSVVGTGGVLVVSAGNTAGFTAPLKKGGNIDGGVFAWGVTDTRPVSWQ
jgi:uncharacterized protein (TIGR03437 family)